MQQAGAQVQACLEQALLHQAAAAEISCSHVHLVEETKKFEATAAELLQSLEKTSAVRSHARNLAQRVEQLEAQLKKT